MTCVLCIFQSGRIGFALVCFEFLYIVFIVFYYSLLTHLIIVHFFFFLLLLFFSFFLSFFQGTLLNRFETYDIIHYILFAMNLLIMLFIGRGVEPYISVSLEGGEPDCNGFCTFF